MIRTPTRTKQRFATSIMAVALVSMMITGCGLGQSSGSSTPVVSGIQGRVFFSATALPISGVTLQI